MGNVKLSPHNLVMVGIMAAIFIIAIRMLAKTKIVQQIPIVRDAAGFLAAA